jgi:hypothetical protein
VPLLHAVLRIALPHRRGRVGMKFASEFALYINFSGIALILWSGETMLSRNLVVSLLFWSLLAELTLWATVDDSASDLNERTTCVADTCAVSRLATVLPTWV